MSPPAAVELYLRGAATLVASWEEYARGATGAAVVRSSGAAVARFPHEPERSIYNNALLDCGLGPSGRAAAIDEMEAIYAQASITSFSAWVHESDRAVRHALEGRRYVVTETTRAMGMSLDRIPLPRPTGVAPSDWAEHRQVGELPRDLLVTGDGASFHILVAALDGENVATALAFDWDADCGIYNVGTLEHARRRGLGTAVTLAHLYGALDRGCRTASLQSTGMAERMHAAVGFQDLGRILEYSPAR
jgi:hypothetical protein